MLLSPSALFALSMGLGALGFWMAYRRNWAAVIPVLAVLVIIAACIVRLRDPLTLAPQYRRLSQDWTYSAVLFWSFVLGTLLPVIGSYLGGRHKR